MTKHLKSFFKGAGSVMDIAPETDYRRFVPKGTPAERIGRHWVRVGKHLSTSMGRFANDQKKKN